MNIFWFLISRLTIFKAHLFPGLQCSGLIYFLLIYFCLFILSSRWGSVSFNASGSLPASALHAVRLLRGVRGCALAPGRCWGDLEAGSGTIDEYFFGLLFLGLQFSRLVYFMAYLFSALLFSFLLIFLAYLFSGIGYVNPNDVNLKIQME